MKFGSRSEWLQGGGMVQHLAVTYIGFMRSKITSCQDTSISRWLLEEENLQESMSRYTNKLLGTTSPELLCTSDDA